MFTVPPVIPAEAETPSRYSESESGSRRPTPNYVAVLSPNLSFFFYLYFHQPTMLSPRHFVAYEKPAIGVCFAYSDLVRRSIYPGCQAHHLSGNRGFNDLV